jgi:hypothetical protein
MAELVNRIVDYRRRILLTDTHNDRSEGDSRRRPLAMGSAPGQRSPLPADTAGRAQDDATASQPPTGGRHRFSRR